MCNGCEIGDAGCSSAKRSPNKPAWGIPHSAAAYSFPHRLPVPQNSVRSTRHTFFRDLYHGFRYSIRKDFRNDVACAL